MKSFDDPMAIYDRYGHEETVLAEEGEAIELWVCTRCGAVVRGLSMELHDDWHTNLESAAKLAAGHERGECTP